MSRVVTGRVVYVGNKTPAEVQAMAEQLRGAIVLRDLPQTQFLDVDRPQPGVSKAPIQTGNPVAPSGRPAREANELRGILQGAGVILKPSPYRDGTVAVLGQQNTTATDRSSHRGRTEAVRNRARYVCLARRSAK